MITTHDVYWLAGLLEGEGCFGSAQSKSPLIQLSMVDRDIVERGAVLLGAKTAVASQDRQAIARQRPRQRQWRTAVYGNRAAGWMMTLYPLLGTRRRGKIRNVLALWRTYVAHQRDREFCKNGHPLVGVNVLAAQWTDASGTVHKKARRCRTCFNAYVKAWRAKRPGKSAEESRLRRRRKAMAEGRPFKERRRTLTDDSKQPNGTVGNSAGRPTVKKRK